MSEEVDFSSLNLNISPFTQGYSIVLQREIFEYLSQLDDNHRNAYQIAYDHLGLSFNVARSNGFKGWSMVLKFLNESDEDIKKKFDYKNDYKFNYNIVSNSDHYKMWLKKQ